jgi:hypothetical protein
VIVACDNGLHEINTNDYTYCQQITYGNYNDVKYFNTKLYALKHQPQSIDVYALNVDKWNIQHTIAIPHVTYNCYQNSFNRLFLIADNIIVATNTEVFIHDQNGVLLKHIKHTEGKQSGQFGRYQYGFSNYIGGFLCGIDDNNTHMYLDYGNNRLQLCDVHGKSTVIELPHSVQTPKDVIVDQDNGLMWIVTDGTTPWTADKKLYKLQIT